MPGSHVLEKRQKTAVLTLLQYIGERGLENLFQALGPDDSTPGVVDREHSPVTAQSNECDRLRLEDVPQVDVVPARFLKAYGHLARRGTHTELYRAKWRLSLPAFQDDSIECRGRNGVIEGPGLRVDAHSFRLSPVT